MVCTSPLILHSLREAELYQNFVFHSLSYSGSIILFYFTTAYSLQKVKEYSNTPGLCFAL